MPSVQPRQPWNAEGAEQTLPDQLLAQFTGRRKATFAGAEFVRQFVTSDDATGLRAARAGGGGWPIVTSIIADHPMTVREEVLAWAPGPCEKHRRLASRFAGSYIGCLGTRGTSGWKRAFVLSLPNVHLADGAGIMGRTAIFAQDGECHLGADTSINTNVHLGAAGGTLVIGRNVLIGPNVVLRVADHVYADPDRPIREQGHMGGTIVIEDDVWLGANVVVTRNVRIGRGTVVGAGSVVTKDVPPLSIVVGVPARVIGSRGGKSTIEVV